MANNRYYIQCPVCKKTSYMGKSLGDGIYNNKAIAGKWFNQEKLLKEIGDSIKGLTQERDLIASGILLEELYTFMWRHMMNCHKDEFKAGELFKIISEYPEGDIRQKK